MFLCDASCPEEHLSQILMGFDLSGLLGVVLVDAFPLEDVGDRLEEYLHVKGEADVVDVVEVELKLLVPTDGVAPIDLRPAGKAWHDGLSPQLVIRIEEHVPHEMRAWANQAHAPGEYVPQLGKLVEGGRPQRLAEAREPDAVRKEIPISVLRVRHAAELVVAYDPVAKSWPLLREDDWTAKLGPHKDGDDEEYW